MQNQIPKNWQSNCLSNLVNIILGGTPSRSESSYWNGNIKWIAIQDIVNAGGRFIREASEGITVEGLKNSAAKLLPKDTIVLSSRGTVGEMGLLSEPMAFNQSCYGLLTKNQGKLDQIFLYYKLKEELKKLKGLAHGGVFDTFTKATFDQIDINYPEDTIEQKRIAKILSVFDDKIEVNYKIAKTLEEMAQTLFKEWFVKFKFPGYEKAEFIDSVFGKIPKDWELKPFGKVAINFDRKRKPLSSMERIDKKGRYPYFGATEIMDHINEYIFDGEYLLIAEDGTVETDDGKAVLQFIEGKFWVNNHAHIIQGTDEAPTFYLYLIFRNISIKPYITGAVQLKLTQENLNKIPVIISSSDVMKQFTNIVYPMILKIRKCQEENQKLTALRDLLLPKLMKGEIRV